MVQYMTAEEAATKWKISHRRVSVLCAENRIPDAAMLGKMWIIPRNAIKPFDARKKKVILKDSANAHPFVKWAGGKGQLVDILLSNLPDGIGKSITKYAEPFVGGGALLFALLNEYDFKEVLICDNNAELINAFSAIKDSCDAVIENLSEISDEYFELSLEERDKYYYIKRDNFNENRLTCENSVEKAAEFIFLNKTCFNGLYRVNKSGKFNVPAGKYKNPLICDEKNLSNVSVKLQNVILKTCDYRDIDYFVDKNTFVYFDPPYRPLTSTSLFTSYTENSFNDKDQMELAEFYKKLSCKDAKVMLSNSDPHNVNYDDDFFDEMYKDFSINRITASRMINSKSAKRGEVTELLIKNY